MAVGGDCELLKIETKSFTPRKKEKIEFFRQLTIGRLYVVVFDFFVAAFLMAHSCCAYINKTARPRRNLKLQIEPNGPNVNTEPILCADRWRFHFARRRLLFLFIYIFSRFFFKFSIYETFYNSKSDDDDTPRECENRIWVERGLL